ncbi:zinc finger HIT domain-containing protein [Aspergillus stella-maris]|uniref:zinc finger HIT domain-containing protein n=1 Tax=Aspergillus stella-maris TaxID=1810926 RepID=UPI003CCD6A9F
MAEEESLLTNLCAICHLQPPKYKCPRCSLRSCSLPCTKKHKAWSQCSGIRDPGAYARRSELATESGFDRDFNFITGIERGIERAGRDAEDRGVDLRGRVGGLGEDGDGNGDGGRGKRKRGGQGHGQNQGLARGEAGFLRKAMESGVTVVKAPKGMSRAKANGSKWLQKQKHLQWTVEFITDDKKPTTKHLNYSETMTIAECYDRAFPLSKEEKEQRSQQSGPTTQEGKTNETQSEETETAKNAIDTAQSTPETSTEPHTTQTPNPSGHSTEQSAAQEQPSTTDPANKPPSSPPPLPSTSHRNMTFYIHRPRTATKQPVLCPISPSTQLKTALSGRTILEFPTIYVLQTPLSESSDAGSSSKAESGGKYILESEYLRTRNDGNNAAEDNGSDDEENADAEGDIPDVDEGKMLEVLQKDLFG